MIRIKSVAILFAALSALSACSGADQPGAGGSSDPLVKAPGPSVCRPLPGCTATSANTCNDGCNNCVCRGGLWACTQRFCVDAGTPPPPTKCDIPECLRAVNCVKECGGPVLQSSCCACPDGTFDDLQCRTPPPPPPAPPPPPPTKCDIPECFRAVNCVKECCGPVLQSSCCACPDGTFDDFQCRSGGGPVTEVSQ